MQRWKAALFSLVGHAEDGLRGFFEQRMAAGEKTPAGDAHAQSEATADITMDFVEQEQAELGKEKGQNSVTAYHQLAR